MMDELHVVDGLRHDGKRTEFLAGLNACRVRVDEFTRTHSERALDPVDWGVPFKTCYEWLSESAGTCEESEGLVREAIEMLRASEPEDVHIVPRIALFLPEESTAVTVQIQETHQWKFRSSSGSAPSGEYMNNADNLKSQDGVEHGGKLAH